MRRPIMNRLVAETLLDFIPLLVVVPRRADLEAITREKQDGEQPPAE